VYSGDGRARLWRCAALRAAGQCLLSIVQFALGRRCPALCVSLTAASINVTDRNVTGRNASKRPLTELQQAILDYLWINGASTAEQVREGLTRRHPLKDSSMRTLLRRLEARGYLDHQVEGKTFVYTATAAPRSVAARTVRLMIDRFWAGSVDQFLIGMVDEKVVSAEALRRLAKKVKKP
jgi:BlaI family transcriptional regulator, penicillinase repressor